MKHTRVGIVRVGPVLAMLVIGPGDASASAATAAQPGVVAVPAPDAQAQGAQAQDVQAQLAQVQLAQTQGARGQAVTPHRMFQGAGTGTATRPAGTLTINHEPIEGLMPAMEMTFRLNPPTLGKGVHPGDEIEFSVEGKTYIITALKVRKHA